MPVLDVCLVLLGDICHQQDGRYERTDGESPNLLSYTPEIARKRTLVDKHPSHTLDRAAYGQRYLLLDAFGCKTLGVLAASHSFLISYSH